jgi:hypothetical protein
MERITRQAVAEKLGAYLRHELSLADLVAWAETAMMDWEFDLKDVTVLRDVVARLGVADVRAFGLAWEDCEDLLSRLGYAARVSIVST